MPLHFLDTSALTKRYLAEVGSTWIDSLCTNEPIAVSTLATVEIASALARRAREGAITHVQRDELMGSFLADRSDMLLQRLTSRIVQRSVELLFSCPTTIALRSLDAIQLASAEHVIVRARLNGIQIGPFVSADTRLLAAAQWAGLTTDNPDNHP